MFRLPLKWLLLPGRGSLTGPGHWQHGRGLQLDRRHPLSPFTIRKRVPPDTSLEKRPGFSVTNDPAAAASFADWNMRNHVFTDMAATDNTVFSITGGGHPEQVEATQITANLLPILGVKPLLGRNFRPEEDQPGTHHSALISANLWQTRYGSDPHVTERTIRLDGVPYVIAGVMRFGFT